MNDLTLSAQEFDLLRRLAREQTGVALGEQKRALVESRLRRRVRDLGAPTFMSYYRKLCDGSAPEGELQRFIDAITTHTTSFFRERAHFEFLARELIPAWARRAARQRGDRIRIWSAACSTGQEPYSIAATLRAGLPDLRRFDAKILGTDVSLAAVRSAEAGCYPAALLDDVPDHLRGFFRLRGPDGSRQMVVSDELRALVVLRPLNLLIDAYPFRGRFDAIFCRNVLIYFDAATKPRVVAKLARYLAPGGHLFLGMSEALVGAPAGLSPIGQSIYERTEQAT